VTCLLELEANGQAKHAHHYGPDNHRVLGLFVVRHTSFNALDLTLIVVVSLIVIKLLKSTISPAISAGVLPMVLVERSWIYPLGIFAGLSVGLATLERNLIPHTSLPSC
jgi:hypothetical protein